MSLRSGQPAARGPAGPPTPPPLGGEDGLQIFPRWPAMDDRRHNFTGPPRPPVASRS